MLDTPESRALFTRREQVGFRRDAPVSVYISLCFVSEVSLAIQVPEVVLSDFFCFFSFVFPTLYIHGMS